MDKLDLDKKINILYDFTYNNNQTYCSETCYNKY